jgi:hypothetical protein
VGGEIAVIKLEKEGAVIEVADEVGVFGPEYTKIQTIFKRDERKVIVIDDWTLPEFEYLKECPWRWTEKVDGTNIRLHWNGENLTLGGRTDNAQVPTFLIAALGFLNNPELWRATFPESPNVTVYGEGYGPKIQNGGQYRSDPALAVFDVRVGPWWLRPEDIADVAGKLGLEMVPEIGVFSLTEAAYRVSAEEVTSMWPNARIEGLVGTPAVSLFDRRGDRIIAKIKGRDFADLRRRG